MPGERSALNLSKGAEQEILPRTGCRIIDLQAQLLNSPIPFLCQAAGEVIPLGVAVEHIGNDNPDAADVNGTLRRFRRLVRLGGRFIC